MIKKSTRGGLRENAGRPKGSLNKETKERREVEDALHQKILRSADKIFNSQMKIAEGCSYLYVIRTEIEGKKSVRKKPELVTEQDTIEAYLAGELDGQEDEYYFITTDKPDNKALDSMLDRVFGKATQGLDITSGGDKLLGVVVLPEKQISEDSLESSTETGDSSS